MIILVVTITGKGDKQTYAAAFWTDDYYFLLNKEWWTLLGDFFFQMQTLQKWGVFVAGLIKGNQWLISPDHKALFLGGYVRGGRWPVIIGILAHWNEPGSLGYHQLCQFCELWHVFFFGGGFLVMCGHQGFNQIFSCRVTPRCVDQTG